MKPLLILAPIALLAAVPAFAQSYEAQAARLDALQAQQEISRQQALAAEREAAAAQNRAETAQALQSLQAARAGLPPPAYAARVPPAPLNARQAADEERLRLLRERSLIESNARIRAVKPAPK